MSTLGVTPSPAPRSSTADAVATGLVPGVRYNGRVDGSVISTKRALRDGSYSFGIAIGATATIGSHSVDIRDTNNKKTIIAGTFAVGAPVIVPTLKTVPVSTIADLNKYKVDDTVDVIDVANGTLYQDVAQLQTGSSLYMGSQMATRTRPLLIQAHTDFGVTLDGKGSGNIGEWFGSGAHDLTMRGFQFANTMGVVLEFGGFIPETVPPNADPRMAPCHDITLLHTKILASCHRDAPTSNQRHGVYFANAYQRGPYNILIDDIEIQGTDDLCLWGGIHMDHGDPGNPAPDHVTVRNLKTTGLCYPIVLWSRPIHDWLFDTADITNPRIFPGISGGSAIRNESIATNVVFRNVVSRGSVGGKGYDDSRGYTPLNPPPGVTFDNCDLK